MAVGLAALALGVAPVRAAVPAHGRVWELVTAGPTNGARIIGTRAWSGDGDRVVYLSAGPMPGAAAGDLAAIGVATRGAAGWVKQPIGHPFALPSPEIQTSEPVALDAGFGAWVWRSSRPLLAGAPPAPAVALYRRAPDGTLTLLGRMSDAGEARFVAASSDTHHAVFQSQAHLLPADAGRVAGGDAYEIAGAELRLVGADSAGTPISACGSAVGDGVAENHSRTHPVSRDGERIWFTAPASDACGEPARVYLRAHGSQTVAASSSACTRPDCGPPADVHFGGASRDGSVAYLITAQQLTDDDVDGSRDLYRYDTALDALTRISAGPAGVDADVGGSYALLSDDGMRAYFVASGELVPGEGVPGSPNVYLSDHGTLRLVATVPDADLYLAAVSTDGGVLAFRTEAPLLPSDTDEQNDVYRYDVESRSLQHVSRGEEGRGNGGFEVTFAPRETPPPLQQDDKRHLSPDGRRVLFLTPEPLLGADTNATPDVYEWVDGALGLVSSGAGDGSVAFEGLSADGRSAFFVTNETLVPSDRNGGDEDLYVARLGGGFPAPPVPPPPCAGDACQGPPGSRPSRLVPPTLGYAEPPARLRIRPPGRQARARLTTSGRATLVVEGARDERVTLVARARIDGRRVTVARVSATPTRAGALRLQVRLRPVARRVLAAGDALRVTFVVRQAGQPAPPPALTVRLGGDS